MALLHEASLYSLSIVGESGRYPLRDSYRHDPEQATTILSDLTGYRPEHLSRLLSELRPGEETTEIGGSALECSCAPLRILVRRTA